MKPDNCVSVIVPVYNGRDFVADAIDSVLQQEGNWVKEIIVIDDGSGDGTAQFIADSYANQVRLIVKPENQGASAARNTGIFSATGEYVAFLDADDIWRSDKLNQQLPVLIEKQAGMVCSSGKVIDINSQRQLNKTTSNCHAEAKQLSLSYIFEHPLIYTASIVLPSQLAQQLSGFNTHYQTAEDTDFILRLAVKHTVYLCPQPLVEYRRRANSLGSSVNSYRDHIQVLKAFLLRQPEFASQHPQLIQRTIRKVYDKWLENALFQRDFKLFYRVLGQSSRFRPSATMAKLTLKSFVLLLLTPFRQLKSELK